MLHMSEKIVNIFETYIDNVYRVLLYNYRGVHCPDHIFGLIGKQFNILRASERLKSILKSMS